MEHLILLRGDVFVPLIPASRRSGKCSWGGGWAVAARAGSSWGLRDERLPA